MVLTLSYVLVLLAERKHIIGVGTIHGRSFIYKIKSKGPKTIPCGIPLLTKRNSEYTPIMVTQCDVLPRKFLIHDKSS